MKTIYFGFLLFISISSVTNAFADELTLNIDKTIYEKSDFISVWGSSQFDSVFISIKILMEIMFGMRVLIQIVKIIFPH